MSSHPIHSPSIINLSFEFECSFVAHATNINKNKIYIAEISTYTVSVYFFHHSYMDQYEHLHVQL